MLRRPVEQPRGLGRRRGIELARPRPDLDPRFDRPEPQIPPHGVARDLELARDTFGAPSSPVQLADLANHLGVDHRHLRSRWCHARRLCRHVSSSLGPREEGSDLDSDGGHYCDRPTPPTTPPRTSSFPRLLSALRPHSPRWGRMQAGLTATPVTATAILSPAGSLWPAWTSAQCRSLGAGGRSGWSSGTPISRPRTCTRL